MSTHTQFDDQVSFWFVSTLTVENSRQVPSTNDFGIYIG